MIKQLVSNKWMFLIISVIFLKPEYFADIRLLDNMFDIGKIIICIFIVILFLCDCLRAHKLNFGKKIRMIYLYMLVLFVSTLLGENRDVYRFIYYYIPVMVFVLFLDYAFRYAIQNVISLLLPILEMLVWVNFITAILFPNGIIKFGIGFLGMKNAQITILLFAVVLSVIRDYLNGNKRGYRTVILLMISTLTFYFNKSTTSFIAMAVLVLIIFAIDITKSNMFNFRNLIFLLIFFLSAQKLVSYLLERSFGKANSFGARQLIWMRTLEQVKLKPILGHGMTLSEYRNMVMNSPFANSAHNQIIEILYQGGIVLLLVFLNIIRSQYKVLMKYYKEDLAKSFAACLFSLFVGIMAEVQAHHLLFFPLMLVPLYYEEISKQQLKRKKRVKIRWLSKKSVV